MSNKSPILLPKKYYLDYFIYILDFVEAHYPHVLDLPEYTFYQTFRALSTDAQCLYLRLANRRGDFFRMKKIAYSEISHLEDRQSELEQAGFISINDSVDLAQFSLLTKEELSSMFDFLDKKQRKERMLQELTTLDLVTLHQQEQIAEVHKNEEVTFIQLLFFGDNRGGITDFVIRDVGHVKLETLNAKNFKPWFQSRDEALAVMHLHQLSPVVRELMAAELPMEEYLTELPWDEWMKYPTASKLANKLLLKSGSYAEKNNYWEAALFYYSKATKHPARERSIRIWDRLQEKEKAIDLARDILNRPYSPTESTFATDFLNRKRIRIDRSMTLRLKNAPIIMLKKSNRQNKVEQSVLEYLAESGWQGIHAENYLWRGLFGLLFWDVTYDTQLGTFHHPLQRQPSDMEGPDFYHTRKSLLESRLNSIKTRKNLFRKIEKTYQEKEGIANRMVGWHDALLPSLEIFIQCVPLQGIKKVLMEIAKDIKEKSVGFPDLFVWRDKEYFFYEVKSPNDHLSAQQLFWINFLTHSKIKTDILRVSYIEE